MNAKVMRDKMVYKVAENADSGSQSENRLQICFN